MWWGVGSPLLQVAFCWIQPTEALEGYMEEQRKGEGRVFLPSPVLGGHSGCGYVSSVAPSLAVQAC